MHPQGPPPGRGIGYPRLILTGRRMQPCLCHTGYTRGHVAVVLATVVSWDYENTWDGR